ncbi:MAG TPA: alpha/beta hydrolase [Streptosporangiaceae bacterium]|nr:alpha/beta hydrolase [Streptosporangiaceae bacterium]
MAAGEFYYAEYGDPLAPPLVLLHGMPSDHSSWSPVAPDLADAGYRVITPDLRGPGASARTSTYSLEEMRDDLHQLAGALGLDRFVLGGHSMGGTVATLFAERFPARLTGLILVDSPPPDGSGSWDPGPRPDGELPYDWAVKPAIFAQLSHPDPAWWADLPAITAPALIIGGGSASPVPQHLLARAAELIPDATLVTIEGAGHVVHQTRPTEFLAAVRPFLRLAPG